MTRNQLLNITCHKYFFLRIYSITIEFIKISYDALTSGLNFMKH